MRGTEEVVAEADLNRSIASNQTKIANSHPCTPSPDDTKRLPSFVDGLPEAGFACCSTFEIFDCVDIHSSILYPSLAV